VNQLLYYILFKMCRVAGEFGRIGLTVFGFESRKLGLFPRDVIAAGVKSG
jgi:hypothetical protein